MDRCYHLYVSLPPCSKLWHPRRATVVSVPENESVHLFATEVVDIMMSSKRMRKCFVLRKHTKGRLIRNSILAIS